MKPLLVYIMGPTCSGKGVLVKTLLAREENNIGLVEVGKAFRAKYPPSYFKGQANPAHLKEEAMLMYREFLARELALHRQLILIDGQPRQGQVLPIMSTHKDYKRVWIHLDASVDDRRSRISQRFPDPNSEEAQLAAARIDNDRITYYDTLVDLLKLGQDIKVVDTSVPIPEWTSEVITHLIKQIGRTAWDDFHSERRI